MATTEIYQQAEEYLLLGKLDEAIAFCQQFPEIIPNLARYCLKRGNLLADKGEFDEAIAAYENALSIQADSPEVFQKLGDALNQRAGLNKQKAMNFYRRLIDLTPYNVALYHQALEIQPYSYEICIQLAKNLVKLERLEEAIIFYQIALITAPEDGEIHLELGKILTDLGFIEKAIAEYKLALETKENDIEVHLNLGKAFSKRGKFEEAEAALNRALEINPNSCFAYNCLGEMLAKKGEVEEAIANLNRAISLNPDVALSYKNLGDALAKQGKIDDASDAYRQGIELGFK